MKADVSLEDSEFVGFNGRCNKPVDTCYAFWVSASLNVRAHDPPPIGTFLTISVWQILGQDEVQLLQTHAIRRFLFEQTQHMIGGFGKAPREPPGVPNFYTRSITF